ncbi:MAG TPA: hypothetical protein VK021_09505 [Flavobacteriaceae bacterium]|nr:hypothetical protein [Flavobacteriaceae bacterium]
MICFGKKAQVLFDRNIANCKIKSSKGIFKEKDYWIAYDNSTFDFWVEEFKNLGEAICWIERIFEISQKEKFKIITISNNLFYIEKIGFLEITIIDNLIQYRLINHQA